MKLSFEKILFGSMIAVAPPAILVVLSVTFWYIFSGHEAQAPYFALSALVIGLIIDIVYFKTWFDKRFQLPLIVPMMLFVFFNLMLFAMFMGFPVFNLIMAPIMGYYVGLRNRDQDLDQREQDHLLTIIPFASAFAMLTLCTVSIFLVLSETNIGLEVQGMFNMKQELSYSIVIAISILGSFALIFSQFFLTRLTLRRALNTRR